MRTTRTLDVGLLGMVALVFVATPGTALPKADGFHQCSKGAEWHEDWAVGLPQGAENVELCVRTAVDAKGVETLIAHGEAGYSTKHGGQTVYVSTAYVDGKLHGAYEEWGPWRLKGRYEQGARTGLWTLAEQVDGKDVLFAEATYAKGILEGPYRVHGECWSSAAKKVVPAKTLEGAYTKGRKHGRWTQWTNIADGTSWGPMQNVGGLIIGGTPSPCRKIEEVIYRDGRRNGLSVEYGSSGSVVFRKAETSYKHDIRSGPFTIWEEGAPHLVKERGTHGNDEPCGRLVRYHNGIDAKTRRWRNAGSSVEQLEPCPKQAAAPALPPMGDQDVFAPLLARLVSRAAKRAGCNCSGDIACAMTCAAGPD